MTRRKAVNKLAQFYFIAYVWNMTDTAYTIGYARVSTDDQDMSMQVAALEKYGVKPELIIKEYASGGTMNRPKWKEVMGGIRKGDTVVIWKMDRLGRTLKGVLDTVEEMRKMGVELVSLTDGVDTTTAMGRSIFQMSLVFSELERGLISERTKAGIAVKRAQGVRFGARHSIADNPKRIEAYRGIVEAGQDTELPASEVLAILNAADPNAKPIKSINTLSNWRKAGLPGLD